VKESKAAVANVNKPLQKFPIVLEGKVKPYFHWQKLVTATRGNYYILALATLGGAT
jgi:hypothetical protein